MRKPRGDISISPDKGKYLPFKNSYPLKNFLEGRMKNRKLLKTVAATIVCSAMAFSALGFTACNKKDKDNNKDAGHQHTYSSVWSKDGSNHWHEADCEHTGERSDVSAHNYGSDYKCIVCDFNGLAPGADDIDNDDSVATYQDVSGTAAAVDTPNVIANTGNGAALVSGTINSESNFIVTDMEIGTLSAQWTDGVFSMPAGTTLRGRTRGSYVKSVQLKDDTGALELNAAAAGTLTLYLENGSSSAASAGIKIEHGGTTTQYSYPTPSQVQTLTVNLTEGGVYTIKRDGSKNGTTDIYEANFVAQVQNTSIASISIANFGKREYLVGQRLDCTGIAVTAKHATTNRISQVDASKLVLDTSAYDATTPGTYSIGVSYTVDGNLGDTTLTFNTSYDVKVYSYDSLKIGVNKIVKDANNAAGNGVYANHAVRQYYFTGETLSTDGLSVIVSGKLGSETKEFLLSDGEYSVTAPDLTSAGKKSVKVSYTANGLTKAVGYNVYAAAKGIELATATKLVCAVNKDFSSKNIGVKNEAGAYRFKTVQQALEFIDNSGVQSTAQKAIYLAEGEYWEKLEVKAPNVSIIGAGRDKTLIEYDALFGEKDDGGFEHTTDSTATLNIRDTAVGFTITGVTVSNYFNTQARFDEFYGNTSNSGERALAMLVQADKVVIDDCALLGYQDTLELFTGRQLVKNSLISGTTDFIFGTNNTTYFYKCEIRSISTHSDDKGGYVTAFKGFNKGHSTDKIIYGAIFDECDFTAESSLAAGKTALGRTWGQDAAVMIMNCTLGAHISKDAGTSRGSRYVKMNGDPASAQFKEYNNTGDGAITASQTGVTVPAATEAAKYNDFSVIFGTTNGSITYADVWNPVK